MQEPRIPDNEEERIAFLQSLDILDTPPERIYDQVTELAADILDVPIALVSIVDKDRQWFKSKCGLDADETGRDISFCGHVVFSNQPLTIPDTLEDARFADNPLVTGEPKIRFYAGLPITIKDNITVGTLCVIDTKPRQLTEDQIRRFEQLKTIVQESFITIRNSLTDPLTSIYNRRMLAQIGEKLIAKANRDEMTFACASIDIDYFKNINDTHGHEAGDKILIEFTRFLQEELRKEDYLFRIGGEEFCILFPGTTASKATHYVERLIESLRSKVFSYYMSKFKLTASIGITGYQRHDRSIDSVLKRADLCLYESKSHGRDRITVFSQTA